MISAMVLPLGCRLLFCDFNHTRRRPHGSTFTWGIYTTIWTLPHTEKRNIEYRDNILSVSGHKLRVGAGGCARIGLNEEQIRAVKAEFEKTRKNGKKKSIPDSEYLIKDRNPILMIHIIDADYVKRYEQEFPEFLFGLGVGIPLDESGNATVVYQVNLVELRNWIAPDADDLDE